MMADDATGVNQIDGGVWLRKRLGHAPAYEIHVRHRAIALPKFTAPREGEHRLGDFIAGDPRAGRAVERKHARRAAGAAPQIEHTQRPIRNMSAKSTWNS